MPWTVAAPAAAASLVVGMIIGLPDDRGEDDAYRAFASSSVRAEGNIIILFGPNATEHDMRKALEAASARLVDGPTASGAYVVRVPLRGETSALERLRSIDQVVLAERLDGQAPR